MSDTVFVTVFLLGCDNEVQFDIEVPRAQLDLLESITAKSYKAVGPDGCPQFDWTLNDPRMDP